MIKEIGSEFWRAEVKQWSTPITDKQHQFLLTGRTALDYIIQDAKISKKINTVYMPSYCCHTMIQPFFDNGIAVEFYNVSIECGKYTYEIDFNANCDTVLIMQYFGYYNKTVGQIIKKLKEYGKTIIEDATHSWFLDSPYSQNSDYVFASFRKWTGVACGAVAIKQQGEFAIQVPSSTNHKYIELRKQAANLKKQFIEKGIGEKETFLKVFKQAECLLESDYQNYNMPMNVEDIIKRFNIDIIRNNRKRNAVYLIEGLNNQCGIEVISQTGKDAPLFVPIIVHSGKRDKLQKHLINNDIYCPVHWPLSWQHSTEIKYLYDRSLSLVCDQRYTLSDMERIIEVVNAFYVTEG